ncbi:MAG: sigma-70 family RNA polymerase sigma factor [Solirubrobacteraceae bacterium]
MAQALAMTPAEFGASLLRVANSSLTTLDGPLGTGSIDGDGSSLLDTHADPTADDPVASMDAEIVRDRVADAVSKLSERSQLVIALRYHENLTLAEIGEVLGVTASRVSQLHTAAVLQLRALLQPSN